jgi:hypothetical protein
VTTLEEARAIIAAADAGHDAEVDRLRRECPDWQSHIPLRMPAAEFDPSPDEQQRFANDYRAAHSDADHRDRYGNTALGTALLEWRQQTANERWQKIAAWGLTDRPCAVCGQASRHGIIELGGQNRPVCDRCRPSVDAAVTARVASEKLPGGRTRAQAADELVAAVLEPKGT